MKANFHRNTDMRWLDSTGIPPWLSGEKSGYNSGDTRDTGLIPVSGGCPVRGHGNPHQNSCQENPWTEEHGYSHGIAKSQTRLKH